MIGRGGSEFPTVAEICRWDSGDDRFSIEFEFGCGLEYYVRRLDCIAFSGKHVLDAGCGLGQWCVALAQRFDRVDGIDPNPARIAVAKRLAAATGCSRVSIARGRLEWLPYPDDCFDSVVCYGVIMFTDVSRSLSEIHRVLKPAGRLYVCANADGWSRHLIATRGAGEPSVRRMGEETLYATYWRRALDGGLGEGAAAVRRLWERRGMRFGALARLTQWRGRRSSGDGLLLATFLGASREGRELRRVVEERLPPSYMERLARDVEKLLKTGEVPRPEVGATAFAPAEMALLAQRAGFRDFEWSVEGGLKCNAGVDGVAARYAGTFEGEPCVWEALATKPASDLISGAPDAHVRRARSAQERRVLHLASPVGIISNARPLPASELEWAEAEAALLGRGYLAKLAKRLLQDCKGQEAAARRIVTFAQGAIFRDPVSQSVTPAGEIPDFLVTLCSARGRCGHVANLVRELAILGGLEARLLQLKGHVIAELKVADRWVIADADAFKYGTIPVNRRGELLSMADLAEDPYQIDRFPASGWAIPAHSRLALDAKGWDVRGYVDAMDPPERGFVAGYYDERGAGWPPSLPEITEFSRDERRYRLAWRASSVRTGRVVSYRVRIGTRSRAWSYDAIGPQMVELPPGDILAREVTGLVVEGRCPPAPVPLFASVTAVSDRVELEPDTWFWPSEEVQVDS